MKKKPTGNDDEFFYLGFRKKVRFEDSAKSSENVDEYGKPFGFYQMSTRGKKINFL